MHHTFILGIALKCLQRNTLIRHERVNYTPPPTVAAASAGSGSQSVECLLQDVVVVAAVVVVVVLVMFVVHKVNEAHYEYGSDMFVSEAVFHLAARAALHARQVKDQSSLNAARTYSHGAP